MLDHNTHRTILLQVLKELYTNPAVGPFLGLKGGTAAHLFYGLDRFSVDLDFDLLDRREEDGAFKHISEVLPKFGAIREARKKRYTLFFVLSYATEAPNIKVEVSRRGFESRYELKNYLGVSMLVMTKTDMFANKLVAMLGRANTANRDIYDVWYFLKKNWAINEELVEKRTSLGFKDYLKKCIRFLDAWNDRNVLSGMGELLNAQQKAWVKSKLKDDLLFLLRLRLDAMKRK